MKTSSTKIVKDWTTKADLRAVILFVNDSHHCGYVAVDSSHPLYEVDYEEECSALSNFDATNEPIGKRGVMAVSFCAVGGTDGEIRKCPGIIFDVHGSITYSGPGPELSAELPNTDNLWWFGFDCAHCDDATKLFPDGIFRDADYVERECESLAKQIAEFPYKVQL